MRTKQENFTCRVAAFRLAVIFHRAAVPWVKPKLLCATPAAMSVLERLALECLQLIGRLSGIPLRFLAGLAGLACQLAGGLAIATPPAIGGSDLSDRI